MTAAIPDDVRAYLEAILDDAHMQVDARTREGIVQELFSELDERLSRVIYDNLSPRDRDTYIEMGEQGRSQREIDAFLSEKIPNARELMGDAIADFRRSYTESDRESYEEAILERDREMINRPVEPYRYEDADYIINDLLRDLGESVLIPRDIRIELANDFYRTIRLTLFETMDREPADLRQRFQDFKMRNPPPKDHELFEFCHQYLGPRRDGTPGSEFSYVWYLGVQRWLADMKRQYR